MKALFFLYDGYVGWEISPLSYMLNISGIEVKTAALSADVIDAGNFRVKVDLLIEAVDPADFDILVIPGGEPEPLVAEDDLLNIIRAFDNEHKWIAAICGASTFLAAASILHDRKFSTSVDDEPEYAHYFDGKNLSEADVTVCENLITAEGNAYIEFAIAVGKELNIFEDREDELETVLFFKNQLRG
ncbi:DJ-1/PfpI family protein [Virgibacillus siamensis]|uniref:DJ-1/PfpI family protein n=1 Tax=Virgibacillus siamensis TaxID=480071 RepID=UPI0009856537|nr:DJ-1/PfpI family protein [Virgibacillus siamensis]